MVGGRLNRLLQNLLHMQARRHIQRHTCKKTNKHTMPRGKTLQPFSEMHTHANTQDPRGDLRSIVVRLEGISSEKRDPRNSSCV